MPSPHTVQTWTVQLVGEDSEGDPVVTDFVTLDSKAIALGGYRIFGFLAVGLYLKLIGRRHN